MLLLFPSKQASQGAVESFKTHLDLLKIKHTTATADSASNHRAYDRSLAVIYIVPRSNLKKSGSFYYLTVGRGISEFIDHENEDGAHSASLFMVVSEGEESQLFISDGTQTKHKSSFVDFAKVELEVVDNDDLKAHFGEDVARLLLDLNGVTHFGLARPDKPKRLLLAVASSLGLV